MCVCVCGEQLHGSSSCSRTTSCCEMGHACQEEACHVSGIFFNDVVDGSDFKTWQLLHHGGILHVSYSTVQHYMCVFSGSDYCTVHSLSDSSKQELPTARLRRRGQLKISNPVLNMFQDTTFLCQL